MELNMKKLKTLVFLVIFFLSVLSASAKEKYNEIFENSFHAEFAHYSVSQLLRYIVKAQQSIHEHKIADAQENLKKAYLLAEQSREFSPNSQAQNYIWVAKNQLSYENADKVIKDLFTIYYSLDTLENKYPVEESRKHVKKAENYLKNSNKEGAMQEFDLAERGLIDRDIDLPLSLIGEYIVSAQTFITLNEMKKADAELKQAEDQIRFIVIDLYSPLPQARKSLWEATKYFEAKETSAAKQEVKRARNFLEKAFLTADTKTSDEIRELLKEIDSLKNKIENTGETDKNIMESLWEKTKALAERGKEYVVLLSKKVSMMDPSLKDIIDAKLHISYAETYQLTDSDTHRAEIEINKADTYLKNAMSQEDETIKVRISSIEKKLMRLKSDLNKRDDSVRVSYDTIKKELNDIIYFLRSRAFIPVGQYFEDLQKYFSGIKPVDSSTALNSSSYSQYSSEYMLHRSKNMYSDMVKLFIQ
jgi:hypothetical protein